MSRNQMGQVFDTASGEQKAYNNEAQTSYGKAQQDVGDYASAVGAFKAQNPYVQGGQAQTVENQQLSDTAAGGAESMGQAVQSAAVRTGQNAGGAIAATQDIAAANQRRLAGEEAGATERRLAMDTGYKEAGLEKQAQVETMQDRLAREQAEAAQGNLMAEERAAETPSFFDTLGGAFGSGFGGAFGKTLGTGAGNAIFGKKNSGGGN